MRACARDMERALALDGHVDRLHILVVNRHAISTGQSHCAEFGDAIDHVRCAARIIY